MNTSPPALISDREAEVLSLLAEGRSNAQIAHVLNISVRTVESHVSSLLRKVGAADRRALATLAGRWAPNHGGPSGRVIGVPHGRTNFVGRSEDCDAVVKALDSDRLVSIMGPGGMGKTRLASIVASTVQAAFPAGVAFVDLTPVRPGLGVNGVASVLGVSERPPQALEDTIAQWIGASRLLLVMDNCEHLIEDVANLLGSILERCPNLSILATTRQRLGIPGEVVVRLGPLPVEPDGVRLFLDRAHAAGNDVEIDRSVVADICGHLDGMPLAIEIAAARAASLGQDGLLAVVEDQLRLLSGARGVPARHASLGAVMAWSYDLLDEPERVILRGLSVFTGRFDLASAAAVTVAESEEEAADILGRLVDRSLVVRESRAGRTRWRVLETIRAFASVQLEPAERRDLLRRYLRWAATVARGLEATLGTGPTSSASSTFDERADDLRAALASTDDEPDLDAHGLAQSMGHLAFARGFYQESRRHFLAAAVRAADGKQATRDICAAAWVATAIYDGETAFRLLTDAAQRAESDGLGKEAAAAWASAVNVIGRFPGEFRGEAATDRSSSSLQAATRVTNRTDPELVALIATARAWHERGGSGLVPAKAAVKAARATGDPILLLGALDVLTCYYIDEGRFGDAHRVSGERLGLISGLPRHDPAAATEITDTFHAAAQAAVACGELGVALDLLDREQVEDPLADHPYASVPRRIRALALVGRFHETVDDAMVLWHEWQRDGAPATLWMPTTLAMAALASGLSEDGQFETWRTRALSAARTSDAAGSPVLAACLAFVDARVALHDGDLQEADRLVDNAFASFPRRHWEAYARATGAELAVAADHPSADRLIQVASPYAADNRWVAACLARARYRRSGDPAALDAVVQQWTAIKASFEQACTLELHPDRSDEGRAMLDALGARPAAPIATLRRSHG